MNYSDFLETPLFESIKETEVKEALNILSFRTCSYSKDELIYHEGSYINEMGIVQSGSLRLERIDYQGNRNILAHIEKGQIFAESYAMLKNEPLMIDVVSNTDCEVLFLNLKKFRALQKKFPYLSQTYTRQSTFLSHCSVQTKEIPAI